ncbi:MAG: hypothetical protein WCZ86_06065 [Desulfurivibrionaceae bacterium]
MKKNLWLRTPSGGGAATIPAVRAFDENTVQTYPAPGTTKDLTLSETWQKLEDLWTDLPAVVKIKGILSDAVSEAIDVCISPVDPGAAGQRTYAVESGGILRVGRVPTSGLASANVNVLGEVETSGAWKTGTVTTGVLDAVGVGVATATDLSVTGACAGMATVTIEATAVNSTGPTIKVETYVNGQWGQAQFAYRTASSAGWTTGISYSGMVAATKIVVGLPPGATQYRLVMTAGAVGPHTIKCTPSATPFVVPNTLVAGQLDIYGRNAHASTASAIVFPAGLESRTTEQTAVASGSSTRHAATQAGQALVWPGAAPGTDIWTYSTNGTPLTANGNTTIVAAVINKRHFVNHITIQNTGSGSVRAAIDDSDGVLVWGPVLLDGDGAVAAMCPPIFTPMDAVEGVVMGVANRALRLTLTDASGTVAVEATVRGFKSSLGV